MTLAAITMTAPEAASPVQIYRATYSPDDNKLRLYAASRLDPETYKKVHDAGFRWAPKQALFVAPAWTPGREDVLLSLAGEIEDEDSTLAERQEARAERFTGYSNCLEHDIYNENLWYESLHSSFFRIIAFRMVNSLRMQATRATFLTFPAVMSRV